MESSDRQQSGNMSTCIIGALVGAGVALLFAPQAGVQMRALLRDYTTRAKDELDEAADRGADAWESAKERGQDFVEKGKESLHEAGRQAKGLAEEGEKAVNKAKSEMASQHR